MRQPVDPRLAAVSPLSPYRRFFLRSLRSFAAIPLSA